VRIEARFAKSARQQLKFSRFVPIYVLLSRGQRVVPAAKPLPRQVHVLRARVEMCFSRSQPLPGTMPSASPLRLEHRRSVNLDLKSSPNLSLISHMHTAMRAMRSPTHVEPCRAFQISC